ncbi:unnamed protein product [Rhizophagus irregularis]|nr:unnamed protein product [Rhizophagus irregularis]
MGGFQGPHPPDSANDNNNSLNSPSFNHSFDISPSQFDRELNFSNILRIGTLNVRSLVHVSKQFNLFSLLFSHQLHGLIVTETNLQSPSHKYVCEPYLSQYNYHKWFSFSSTANHHAGVGILLHSSLAMYVIKKRFFKDRLISLLLQLPGRQNLLVIGAYIPPASGLNNKIIAECHSTLINWITSARASGTHVMLGGDLNANFDNFIKHISNDEIRTPSHPLFRFLFTHQFDDLCALDPSTSLPMPTFTSASSGQLSRLDYLWTSPDFPATHLWSHVMDNLNTFSSDHMLLIGFFDFLAIRDMRAPSYLKQRSRYRTVYNCHAALPDQKVLFTSEVDVGLKSTQATDTYLNLNRIWHRFKTALLTAARSAFPKQVISLNKTKKTPVELQPYQHISHKLDHYIRSLSRHHTISELYGSWNRFYPSFCPLFHELFSDRTDLINQFPAPASLYSEFIASNLSFNTFLNKFKGILRPVQRLISAKLKLEFDHYKHDAMKSAIAERNANFYEDKGKFIRSSLNREKRSIVLDRVLVTDIPGSPQLLIAPDDIHAAAIKHFQNIVGPSRSPFKSLNELPERWKNRYAPLSEINPDIYQLVMVPIDISELRAVINNSPSQKAPGPSSIPYEWFKLLSTDGISYLCQLMNSCLVSADIPDDWRLASIVPIPKPHEFECLLKNTRPITLLETARKLLVKIITNRLSKIMTTHQVLTGDNFAGLPGSSVTTPINVLDGIMKSHRISSSSQELWILSQDISKAFDSIDLGMLKLSFDRLKFPPNLSKFIISLFTSRKNNILTPFGRTDSYNLLIGIDQGEIISPLLWTIYFDPLLTELSTAAIAPYIWSSGISKDILSINNNEDIAVPISQLTYMDDSTLVSSSLDGLENLLSIARDFYFLNNITANFQKYELVSSKLGNALVTFNLTSEISNHLPPMSFSLQALKLSTSFRFLGVWFNLQGSPNFVLSQVKDIYSNFMASVRFKKLSSPQLAYLHSSVIIPKVQYRSQVLYLSESQIMRIAKGYYSLQRKALSLARTFPTIALTSRFFNKDTNPYDSLCERLVCRFLAWISLIPAGSKYANWVLITLRTLQGTLKWPSSLDSINDFSLWTSKRRSTSHNWLFQTIILIKSIGLQLDFPDNTFLELMPNESCPLVSISPSLANLETPSWLKSALWCLSQLLDPFRNFQYSWMDLKKMGLAANTSRIPSWFKEISAIPSLPSLLITPFPSNICITPSLSSLIGKFVDKIDEVAYIRLRNKYYWIAGLDSSNSLIFGRAFYTLDDSFGNRIIYFSHWIPTSHDRMVLTPCPGCSLHCLEDNEGPLALKSVGGKLIHRSCLSILPSYRCLNLYQMTVHIDLSQHFINLKLSPYILCSYFRFLLGFSEMYIPEHFLVMDTSSLRQSDDSPTYVPLDPTLLLLLLLL